MSDAPPPASSLGTPPPPPAAPDPASPSPAGARPTLLIAALAVTSLALLGAAVLFVAASGARSDAEDERDELATSLDAATAELDAASETTADLRAQIDRADTLAEEQQDAIDELDATIEDLRGEADDGEELAEAVVGFFAVVFGVEGVVDEANAECVARALIGQSDPVRFLDRYSSLVRDASERDFVAFGLDIADAADTCGAVFTSDEFLAGDIYGDNAELDALWDECADGSPVSCDSLYISSAIGSEYERFGGTCGDRLDEIEPFQSCAEFM